MGSGKWSLILYKVYCCHCLFHHCPLVPFYSPLPTCHSLLATPYLPLGTDVYDLLFHPHLLQSVAAALPANALVLVIAGPPCQDLSRMGPDSGARGICGERSSLALLVPAIAGLLQRLRSDLHDA